MLLCIFRIGDRKELFFFTILFHLIIIMEIKKISQKQFDLWLYTYNKDFILRLGQRFCNDFDIRPLPVLFYEQDSAKAIKYIVDNLVEWDSTT
jgi:hypothetical protein